jgi:hypothetical protein
MTRPFVVALRILGLAGLATLTVIVMLLGLRCAGLLLAEF